MALTFHNEGERAADVLSLGCGEDDTCGDDPAFPSDLLNEVLLYRAVAEKSRAVRRRILAVILAFDTFTLTTVGVLIQTCHQAGLPLPHIIAAAISMLLLGNYAACNTLRETLYKLPNVDPEALRRRETQLENALVGNLLLREAAWEQGIRYEDLDVS